MEDGILISNWLTYNLVSHAIFDDSIGGSKFENRSARILEHLIEM